MPTKVAGAGLRESTNVVDLQLTPRQREQIRNRKGFEALKRPRILAKPLSSALTYGKPLTRFTGEDLGARRAPASYWAPDFAPEGGGWEKTYSYYPSTAQRVRTTYGQNNPPPTKFEQQSMDLTPLLQVDHPDFQPVVQPLGQEPVMPAWGVGLDLSRGERTRWGNNPMSRQNRQMEELKALVRGLAPSG